MNITDRSGKFLARGTKTLLSLILVIGLLWIYPGQIIGQTNQPRNFLAAAAASDPVIAAAGDIACDPANSVYNNGLGNSANCRQKYTSDLIVNAGLTAVLDLGDNQYFCGGYQAFMQSYDPTWGRVKSITHPSVGNHEYLTSGGTDCTTSNEGAAGYFNYFGSAAGTPGQGYYSFDIGAWHIIALNSNCPEPGGCGPSSAQYQWLQNDLTTHSNFCTLAYWHIPLYSSGGRAAQNTLAFWQLLYNNNADLILNGHDHIYERFAPQDSTGTFDLGRGIREFIVGTGGSDHTTIPPQIAANSEVRNADTYGVIKLTLHPTSYNWQFVPEAGKTFTDSGVGACHSSTPDTTPPSAPSDLTSTAVAWNQVNLSWTPSTDNIAVVGYHIFRNGIQIGTTSTNTTYVDAAVQPQTPYTYSVKAVDGVGLTSSASNSISLSTPSAPTIITFTPSADTYTNTDLPTTNFGSSTQLGVGSSPGRNTYLKFAVSGVGTKQILNAKLRLYCVNASPNGEEIHRVADTTWSETGLTLNTAPPADTNILATLGSVVIGSWYEVDVTPLITGDGTYSVRINSTSTDGAYFSSKEGSAGFAPQLVLSVYDVTVTPTITVTPTSTATMTPTASPTSSPTSTVTFTPTASATDTPTTTVTQTSTPTMTATPTLTNTATFTATPTDTQTPTFTPTATPSFTLTPQPSLLFSDGFESGDLSQWTLVKGLVAQNQEVTFGSFAARGTSAAGTATYARKLLSTTQNDVYYRTWFKVVSKGANTMSLLKFRTAADVSILSVGLNSLNQLNYHNDITGTSAFSTLVISPGSWQSLQVHVHIADTASQVEVWINGVLVSALSRTDALGATPIGRLQLGENTSGLTYDVVFDNVAASTVFISP